MPEKEQSLVTNSWRKSTGHLRSKTRNKQTNKKAKTNKKHTTELAFELLKNKQSNLESKQLKDAGTLIAAELMQPAGGWSNWNSGGRSSTEKSIYN